MVLFLQIQVLFLVCFMLTHVFGFNYCADKSCKERNVIHTMCKYPTETIACTGDKVKGGLTEELKKAILDRHNVHRQTVATGKQSPQPSASNMMELIWHDEAEKIAQRWANQCTFAHDSCRNINYSWVGQNVADGYATKQSSGYINDTSDTLENVLVYIDDFFNEVKDFDKRRVDKYLDNESGPPVGHYTQMVWAKTTGVGCGYTEVIRRYTGSNHVVPYNLEARYLLVCNYVPGGNILGEPLYKKGKACSECPGTTKCSMRYPGLCTTDKGDFGGNYQDYVGRDGGYPKDEVRNGGYPKDEGRDGGHSKYEGRDHGYPKYVGRDGGYPKDEVRNGGYPKDEVKDGGYSKDADRDGGYLKDVGRDDGYPKGENGGVSSSQNPFLFVILCLFLYYFSPATFLLRN